MNSDKTSRLLLVDDHRDTLEVWSMFLIASNYEVITARTGREAIEHAEHGQPDLVLLDMRLPEMSGTQVASHLRGSASTAHIPLIAVTGSSEMRDEGMARRAGFDGVLIKPCDPRALLAEVERVLRSARAVPPS